MAVSTGVGPRQQQSLTNDLRGAARNGFRQKGHCSMLVLAEDIFRSKTRQSAIQVSLNVTQRDPT